MMERGGGGERTRQEKEAATIGLTSFPDTAFVFACVREVSLGSCFFFTAERTADDQNTTHEAEVPNVTGEGFRIEAETFERYVINRKGKCVSPQQLGFLAKKCRIIHEKLAELNQLSFTRLLLICKEKYFSGWRVNQSTWDAWALERVGEGHADLGHAVALQQRVPCNLLPALQSGKRESSRARNHQPRERERERITTSSS